MYYGKLFSTISSNSNADAYTDMQMLMCPDGLAKIWGSKTAIICSQLTIETLEQGVKYVQS